MSAINVSETMDALAANVPAAASAKVYAWPVENITVPCAVVGYPSSLDFDTAFGRGGDKAVFPLYFMVGKAGDRNARDKLSSIITGAYGIKNALDGALSLASGGTVAVRVTNCQVEEVTVAAVPYLAARFDCEVLS